ncbi:MAG: hypothetical protein VX944_12785 [Myxococcota bacterium]|nr:hypothetical protein [Myxococcota bacterium]MEC9390941.1 hypothetical protein [Myxococcota bacterium]
MLTSLLLLSTATHAANITDLPPQYRGDIGIAYTATVIPDTLEQDRIAVGERRTIAHDMVYEGRFGITDYLMVALELPHAVKHEVRFFNSNAMAYDPISETGTMLGTGPIEDSSRSGSGLGGTRFRIAGAPFSETVFADRGDRVTWVLGVGFQFRDDSNFWTTDGGERGAGPGSSAFEIDSTWSTDHQHASPYIAVAWSRRAPNNDGPVPVKDPSDLWLVSGLEIPLWGDPSWADGLGTEVVLDLSGRFGYHTYGDGVSGVLLPAVLPISRRTAATQSETSSLWGNVDVRWRAARYVDWSLRGAMGGVLGHRLEHHYPVRTATGSKVGWSLGTAVTFRMRDPLFDQR